MRVNEIKEMAISDTSDFEQDERSFQPLIYLEYVLGDMMFFLDINSDPRGKQNRIHSTTTSYETRSARELRTTGHRQTRKGSSSFTKRSVSRQPSEHQQKRKQTTASSKKATVH